jgi:hypothetical protein
MTACDLTNGELIENRSQTCADLNPDLECVLVSYTGGGISWGSRIGTCADTITPPFLNVWDLCAAGTCPPGTICIEEDVYAAVPVGPARCVPYCDTANFTPCNTQHVQLPANTTCTTVSNLFTGLPCTETVPSKLGLCALTP